MQKKSTRHRNSLNLKVGLNNTYIDKSEETYRLTLSYTCVVLNKVPHSLSPVHHMINLQRVSWKIPTVTNYFEQFEVKRYASFRGTQQTANAIQIMQP